MDPTKYQSELDESGQISASLTNPETNQYNLIPNETRIDRSNKSIGSVLGYLFPHPKFLGQVRVGHKPDSWTTLPLVYAVSRPTHPRLLYFLNFFW